MKNKENRNFNVLDINYKISCEGLNFIRKQYFSASLLSLLSGIAKTFIVCINIFKFRPNYSFKRFHKTEYAFWCLTRNNIRALQPIQKRLDNSTLFEYDDLPWRAIYLKALFYVYKVLCLYFKNNGYLKNAIASNFHTYCLSYAYIPASYTIHSKTTPLINVFANDHTNIHRALFRVSEKLGIKTAYLQHASVTAYFPPLEFDYAFLDGMESFEKYIKNKPCKSTVFLSGASRFDYQIKNRISQQNCNSYKIGIAVNILDQKEKVVELVKHLVSMRYDCVLRPHPGQSIIEWKEIAEQLNCEFSLSTKENPLDFIANADIFIAGTSSIHLDVAIMGKQSFYFNFTNQDVYDHYGYLQNNLITDISNVPLNSLSDLFIQNFDRTQIIRYYVANYATKYWGKASDIIAQTLYELVNNKKYPEFWVEKERNGINYLVLNET